MEKEIIYIYGLLGKNISYSFSRDYFTKKFSKLDLKNHIFKNFDIPEISGLSSVLNNNKENLKGFNVTIPYKEQIFRYLDKIDTDAKKIGAVNVVKILDSGKLKGYNTDSFGFENSIKPLLQPHHDKALILGTGGASKAVAFILDKLNISYLYISRKMNQNSKFITYEELTKEIFQEYTLIINTTPVGTFPNIDECPKLPYHLLTPGHFLYDLIYNPAETTFLKRGKSAGTTIKNGLEMLELQAEKAWEIWNS